MCVVSMILDHRYDEWQKRYPWQVVPWPNGTPLPQPTPIPTVPPPTDAEIAEFRRLLDRAREYDRRNHEPDCEMDDKKQKLLDMARELGVDISFINSEV